jgi:ketosteroid isomerase-like protein
VKEETVATKDGKANDEAQISKLIDRWLTALRAKDLDGIMSCYAPDILLFDILPPLQSVGADAYRKNWAEWFPRFQGPIGYEIRNLRVTSGNDVAFSHSLNRISGKRTDGEETECLGAGDGLLQQDRRQVENSP